MTPQLCLGTAQFGLNYGITNAQGQVPEASVAELLAQAGSAGVRWLDTAQAYGNAEAVLGKHLPESHSYQVISKLPSQKQSGFTSQDLETWEQSFQSSYKRLGIESMDTFLVHASADLRKPGSNHLEAWLLGLQERGLVKRLGVSIYSSEDLKGINTGLLDVVQLPLSLLDQRLLQDGTVAYLHSQGTAVHARSIYLQGLLLTPAALWPNWVKPDVRAHQEALEAMAKERECRLIDLALGFAREQEEVEAVVVGLCSVTELNELQAAWTRSSPWQEGKWKTWALKDPAILDPRTWPQP